MFVRLTETIKYPLDDIYSEELTKNTLNSDQKRFFLPQEHDYFSCFKSSLRKAINVLGV